MFFHPWSGIVLLCCALGITSIANAAIRRGIDCMRSNDGKDYFGQISVSESGRTCQRWDLQTPHAHSYTNDWYYPDRSVSLAENYCRNPETSGDPYPWCYTTDPDVRWEYCDVPRCSSFPECKQTASGVEYSGYEDMTSTGQECVAWGAGYPDDMSNFCRNPDSKPDGPWCFTDAGQTEWEYCDVPFCKPSASCLTEPSGSRYVGTTSMTRRNVPCQRWAFGVPHTSNYTDPDDFPDATLKDAADFCRNPASSKSSPWCYTLDPDVEWDFCDIPVCTGCKVTDIGREYAGAVASTSSGRSCQRWDSQSPHEHVFTDPDRYPDASLEDAANFCRNPDKDPEGPWCFTTDPEVVKESCVIPLCQDDADQPVRGVKHVVHIGIDGLHPCLVDANVENMMNRIAAQGSYTLTKGRSVLPSVSQPGWTTQLCGIQVESSGAYSNGWTPPWLGLDWSITPITGGNVPMPCLMDILQRTDADVHTAMFYDWDGIRYSGSSGSPGRVDEEQYCDQGYELCDLDIALNVSAFLNTLTETAESSYSFVYLGNVDAVGHSRTWCSNDYLDAVSTVDGQVGMILDAIDVIGMTDDIMVVVTTDHAGLNFGHGTNVDDDLITPVFFRGPGIKQNYQFEYEVSLEDIAPTIAHSMGYKASPWWDGHVLNEMFQ